MEPSLAHKGVGLCEGQMRPALSSWSVPESAADGHGTSPRALRSEHV